MTTLRNKWRLAAVSRKTQKSASNSQLRNTSVPVITEEYIAQVAEKFDGRVTKKPSQKLSRIKSGILGALSKLVECLLKPQIETFSGIIPEGSGTTT